MPSPSRMIRENESTTRKPSPDGTGDQQPAIVGAEVERGIDAGPGARQMSGSGALPRQALPSQAWSRQVLFRQAWAHRRDRLLRAFAWLKAVAKPRIVVHQTVFPRPSWPARISVHGNFSSAGPARNSRHIGPCPIRRCRWGFAGLSRTYGREIAQKPVFQVPYMQDHTVPVLAGKRYRTAKIRRRAAGPAQGRRHPGAGQR